MGVVEVLLLLLIVVFVCVIVGWLFRGAKRDIKATTEDVARMAADKRKLSTWEAIFYLSVGLGVIFLCWKFGL